MAAASRAPLLKASSARMRPAASPDSAKKWRSATRLRTLRASTRPPTMPRRATRPQRRRLTRPCRSPARAVARPAAPGIPVRPFPPRKRCSGWPFRGPTSTRIPAHSPRYSRRQRAAHNPPSRPPNAPPAIQPGASLRRFSGADPGPGPMPRRRPFSRGLTGLRRPFSAGLTRRRRRRPCLRLRRQRPSVPLPRQVRAPCAGLPEWRKWFRPTSRRPRMTLATICPNLADPSSSARSRLSPTTRCRLSGALKRPRRPCQPHRSRPSAQPSPPRRPRNGRPGRPRRPPDCSAGQQRRPRERSAALSRQPGFRVRPPLRRRNLRHAPSMPRPSARQPGRRRSFSASPRVDPPFRSRPKIDRRHRSDPRPRAQVCRFRSGQRLNRRLPRRRRVTPTRRRVSRFSAIRPGHRAAICPWRGLPGRKQRRMRSPSARRLPVRRGRP